MVCTLFGTYRSIASVFPILLTSLCILGLMAIFSFTLWQLEFASGPLLFPFFNTVLVLVGAMINRVLAWVNATSSAVCVFGFTSFSFTVVLLLVCFVSSWSIILGKNLPVRFSGGSESGPDIDHVGFLALIFFLAARLGPTLWYGYIYDSHDTVNPAAQAYLVDWLPKISILRKLKGHGLYSII